MISFWVIWVDSKSNMNETLLRRAEETYTIIEDYVEDRHSHTERTQWDDGSRDWSEASTNPGIPTIMRNHPKLGERYGTFF